MFNDLKFSTSSPAGVQLPRRRLVFSFVTMLLLSLFVVERSTAVILDDGKNNDNATIVITGVVLDAETQKPLPGATVFAPNTTLGTTTDRDGKFTLKAPANLGALTVSIIGYRAKNITLNAEIQSLTVRLEAAAVNLQPVVVSAGRVEQARTEAPVAIATISAAKLNEVKPSLLHQALNKVAGVYNVDLGGSEENAMSVRQPISYKAFFLYLEDGIPIRPTGLFNHNSLYEINMTGIDRFEVIKGPSSSLYGSNAIGGAFNFFTPQPSEKPTFKAAVQGSDIGNRRADFTASATKGRLGFYAGGYFAQRRDGWAEHSDYDKISATARVDYAINDATKLVATFSTNHLDNDMTGSLDSLSFYRQKFTSLQTFTFRKVHATRVRSTLEHTWNAQQKSDFTLFYRDNSTLQNPSYRVRNNRTNPAVATGEDNDQSFTSLGVNLQHRMFFNFKKANLLAGITVDRSPSTYRANFITIKRDVATGQYVDFTLTDSLLTRYDVDLINVAPYMQFEMTPFQRLKFVAGLRYDRIDYEYDNYLTPSAFSGAPDEKSGFNRVSPKVGFTYDFGLGRGLYGNFSQGFQPPEIGELYRGVKVPFLESAYFNNYEAGGWLALAGGKIYLDASVYSMDGDNEIISIQLDDGSTANANAGKTRHSGIEYAVTFSPSRALEMSFGGTNAKHKYIAYQVGRVKYDGKEMEGAANWIFNADATLRPAFLKNSRFGFEWQHVGPYFLNVNNTQEYEGYDIFNLRLAYRFAGVELWSTVYNLTDELHATVASLGAFGHSYTRGQPRHFIFGVSQSF